MLMPPAAALLTRYYAADFAFDAITLDAMLASVALLYCFFASLALVAITLAALFFAITLLRQRCHTPSYAAMMPLLRADDVMPLLRCELMLFAAAASRCWRRR